MKHEKRIRGPATVLVARFGTRMTEAKPSKSGMAVAHPDRDFAGIIRT